MTLQEYALIIFARVNVKSHAMTMQPDLPQRAQILLKTLIEQYIRGGQPVGSQALVKESRIRLSPATVRNVMSDLEDLGLVASPHTSAGRIPTAKGYRMFVDSLLTVHPLEESEIDRMRLTLNPDSQPRELVNAATDLLSEISRMASVVLLPRREQVTLRQVELLPLSENRVLVVLVINKREVQNRIIHTDRTYAPAELQQAANYLTERFAGRNLAEIRTLILQELNDAREEIDHLLRTAIEMANKAFAMPKAEDDFVVSGATNLLGYAEMGNVERLQALFETFQKKKSVLHLLDKSLHADGVKIFIGDESGYGVFDDCSVVTAPYRVDGNTVGVLGVIGPTRMAYQRMIPVVDVTARLLGAALNSRN